MVKREKRKNAIFTVIFILLSLLTLFPFLIVVMNSFKTNNEIAFGTS